MPRAWRRPSLPEKLMHRRHRLVGAIAGAVGGWPYVSVDVLEDLHRREVDDVRLVASTEEGQRGSGSRACPRIRVLHGRHVERVRVHPAQNRQRRIVHPCVELHMRWNVGQIDRLE